MIRHPAAAISSLLWRGDSAGCPQKHVDADIKGVQRLQQFQQLDSRRRVDRFGFDHTGLPGFQIDRAVDIDAPVPARLFNRQVLLLRRSATHGSRGMGGMDRRDLVVAHGGSPSPTPSRPPIARPSHCSHCRPCRNWSRLRRRPVRPAVSHILSVAFTLLDLRSRGSVPYQCHTNEIHLNARKLSAELRGAMNREIVGSPEGRRPASRIFPSRSRQPRTSAIALVNRTVAGRPSASVQVGKSFLKNEWKSGVSVHEYAEIP